MAPVEFAAYGYQLDNTVNKLTGLAIGSVFLSVPCAIGLSRWFLLLLLVPVGIFIYIKRSGITKPLVIASRYLILGERIVYFGTINRASLDKERQILTLTPDRGGLLVISAEKFPTNARKPDKIRINKTAKFEKVADKVIARLRAASPEIIIS